MELYSPTDAVQNALSQTETAKIDCYSKPGGIKGWGVAGKQYGLKAARCALRFSKR